MHDVLATLKVAMVFREKQRGPWITVTVPLKKTTQASLRSAGATVVANAGMRPSGDRPAGAALQWGFQFCRA